MNKPHPVEFTARYAQSGFSSLNEAWVFVMDHVDKVGDDPSIEITPYWSADYDDVVRDENYVWPRMFSAVVSGMVKEKDNG